MGKKRLRNVTGIFLFVLIVSLAGCGKKETVQGETTEIFGTYTMSDAGALKSNGNGYLKFYDRESDSVVYLCNKVGCQHLDSDCNAYVEGLNEAFFYNDSLYIIQTADIENFYLIKANRYGEERQVLGEFRTYPLPSSMVIFEDDLYFIGIGWDYETDTDIMQMCRLNLSDGSYEEIPNLETGYPLAELTSFLVTEDYNYLVYTAGNMDVSDFLDIESGTLTEVPWDEFKYTVLLYRVDRETLETEVLYQKELSGSENFSLRPLEVDGSRFILQVSNEIMEYDAATGQETLLYEISGSGQIKKAGEYYIVWDYTSPVNFILLKDWKEEGTFMDESGAVNTYFGTIGDTVYFGGDGVLYSMSYTDLKTGNYAFHYIDL
ncbi:MAG: hypothetical protein ACI4SE_01765 [Lachnospiraceae bacterium]